MAVAEPRAEPVLLLVLGRDAVGARDRALVDDDVALVARSSGRSTRQGGEHRKREDGGDGASQKGLRHDPNPRLGVFAIAGASIGCMPEETPVEVLRRWEDHGAEWRVLHLSDDAAIVDLCTCYGEPVERL